MTVYATVLGFAWLGPVYHFLQKASSWPKTDGTAAVSSPSPVWPRHAECCFRHFHLDMQKGCLSLRSTAEPSESVSL